MPRRVEITDRGRDPNPVAAIPRPRPDAGRSWIVVIGDIRIAMLATRVVKGAIDRLPRFLLRPLDPDGTAAAVKVALRVAIVFEFAIVRQDLREAPFGVAPFAPLVEIFGCTPQCDMAIDGRRTA